MFWEHWGLASQGRGGQGKLLGRGGSWNQFHGKCLLGKRSQKSRGQCCMHWKITHCSAHLEGKVYMHTNVYVYMSLYVKYMDLLGLHFYRTKQGCLPLLLEMTNSFQCSSSFTLLAFMALFALLH